MISICNIISSMNKTAMSQSNNGYLLTITHNSMRSWPLCFSKGQQNIYNIYSIFPSWKHGLIALSYHKIICCTNLQALISNYGLNFTLHTIFITKGAAFCIHPDPYNSFPLSLWSSIVNNNYDDNECPS